MPFTTLLVDLDDTVYPANSGMWDAIAARIDRYMHERLGIPVDIIPNLRHELHGSYGTTLRGLAETRSIDELDYLAFVHNLPIQNFLTPDPEVRAALRSIRLHKWIFTNADRAHAERVLTALDLLDQFEGIIDIHVVSPYCKPMPEAYRLALSQIGSLAHETIFVDDAPRNLQPAREMGLSTVLVGSAASQVSGIPAISSLAGLSQIVDHLCAPNGFEEGK